MSKRKPVARIVFENYRDEYVIVSDEPVEVLVVDHTWDDEPRRVLNRPVVCRKDVETEFGKLCPVCKRTVMKCHCRRKDKD